MKINDDYNNIVTLTGIMCGFLSLSDDTSRSFILYNIKIERDR